MPVQEQNSDQIVWNIKFSNKSQEDFFYARERNQCLSGAFNSGKTYVGILKCLTLLTTFPCYRVAICRQTYTELRSTTMASFFKMCPASLILSHNEQEGSTRFRNGSMVKWVHLDRADDNMLRGLEMNSILVDQCEEIDEKVYDVLEARLGRWDGSIVPAELLQKYPDWPLSSQGIHIVPSYLMLLTNPDTQFHFIYRKYHPDSLERNTSYFYAENAWDSSLGSEETYQAALTRDDEWKDKYVKGIWGLSSAAIHNVPKSAILDPTPELLELIRAKGNFFRILDHGAAAPTCCLWPAAVAGVYIFFREYYVANKPISYHRKAISELSTEPYYTSNYADPSIFKKTSPKEGGYWSVADEYRSSDIEGPPLFWLPADNNEFATRNRINELLRISDSFRHPVTGESPACGMYFIKKTPEYPYGCYETIKQLGMQRKKLLGTLEGKNIYSDDRDDSIPDHAYDDIRYFVAMHGAQPKAVRKKPARNSFAFYSKVAEIRRGRNLIVPGSAA